MLQKDKLYQDYGPVYREYRLKPYKNSASYFVLFLILWCISLVFFGMNKIGNYTLKPLISTSVLLLSFLYYTWKDYTRDRTETVFAICEDGLYAPMLPLGTGRCFIPWQEVKSIWIQGYIASYKRKPPIQHSCVFLWLYNIDDYFKELPILQREFREKDKNVYNTHLYFYLSSLDCDPDELLSSLEFYRKRYRKRRVNRVFAGAAAED